MKKYNYDIPEKMKTCGRCEHENESENDVTSPCFNCIRNGVDNRVDMWDSKPKERE